jgi:hypothetical protein
MRFSDGTTISTAQGLDQFKLRSGDNSLTITITDNDATHGDNANFIVHAPGIDHNALLNFVPNKHIDHSTVLISAGSGLAGGGDITASRNLTLDINSLLAGGPTAADSFAFYSAGFGGTRQAGLATLNSMLDHDALLHWVPNKHIDHSLVTITAGIGLIGGGDLTAPRVLSLDINGLTADTPLAGDFIPFFDSSGNDTNKAAVTGSGNVVLSTSPQINSDIRPIADASASLGIAGDAWSNLFLSNGAKLDFNNGAMTLTHSAGELTLAGGALRVPDAPYNPVAWDGNMEVPTKNAIRDVLVGVGVGSPPIDLASPPPIGNVAPNSAVFTTVASTGALSVGGLFGNNYNMAGVFPPPADGTLAKPGFALGGNFSNGFGETDFWNTNVAFSDAFRFYKLTGAGAGKLVLDIDGTGNITSPTLHSDMTDPTQTVQVPSFGPGVVAGAQMSLKTTWAAAIPDTTLRVQTILEAGAPAGGSGIAIYGGALSKQDGHDTGGVLGVIANILSGTLTTPYGAGIWGLSRYDVSTVGGNSYVDIIRATAENNDNQHARSGVAVVSSTALNAAAIGVFVQSAKDAGVRVGPCTANPQLPFCYFDPTATLLFWVDAAGNVNSPATTAFAAYTPSISASSGSITTPGASTGRWKLVGKKLTVSMTLVITTNGTGAGVLMATLPAGLLSQGSWILNGRSSSTGGLVVGITTGGSNSVSVVGPTSGYPGGDGAGMVISGEIEVQ